MTTTLANDEILVEARLPLLPPGTRWGFYEFSRRAGDYALAMALVTFELVDGRIAAPRIGVGGVEGRPRRIPDAEAALIGGEPTAETFRAAAEAAAAAVDPLEDMQASAGYRRDLVHAVTRRALERAVA
jgi:carbon-monoxide dehydrogenase medium subunit